MAEIRRILAATDFSDYSGEAVDYAVNLAKFFGAELYLLHVFQNPFLSNVSQLDAVVEELKNEASRRLLSFSERLQDRGVKVIPVFKEEVPFVQILKTSEEVEADLIVLGTHGHTGLDHLLMGSVAERVVQRASCPVLTVRPRSVQKKRRKALG